MATTGAQQTKQAAAASLAALKTLQAANASRRNPQRLRPVKDQRVLTPRIWPAQRRVCIRDAGPAKELQKADEDRAKAAQDAYDKLKTTATGYYQTVLEGRTLLMRRWSYATRPTCSKKAAIAEQGAARTADFQSSNEAKLEAARQADANESFPAQARMDRLNSEHAEKLALVQQAFEAEILSAQEAAHPQPAGAGIRRHAIAGGAAAD